MEPREWYEWILHLLHYLPAALVYGLCAGLLFLGAIVVWRKAKELAIKGAAFVDRLNATMDKIDTGLERGAETAKTVQALHDVQAVQAENHLHTIETEAVKQTALLQEIHEGQAVQAAKFDTLIDIMGRRA